jgi:mannose/fructose-specific phosphotransferase system component IIA
MKKMMIATHGYLADGFKSSLSILCGMEDQVSYIDAYVDETDYTPALQSFIDGVGEGDAGIILTDVYGGSVCQKVALLSAGHPNVFHITGINLGLVIELLLTQETIDADYLRSVIGQAREGMALVSMDPSPEGETGGEPDDFFD